MGWLSGTGFQPVSFGTRARCPCHSTHPTRSRCRHAFHGKVRTLRPPRAFCAASRRLLPHFFPSGIDMLPPNVPGVLLLFSPQARNVSQPDINKHVATPSASRHATKNGRRGFCSLVVLLFVFIGVFLRLLAVEIVCASRRAQGILKTIPSRNGVLRDSSTSRFAFTIPSICTFFAVP